MPASLARTTVSRNEDHILNESIVCAVGFGEIYLSAILSTLHCPLPFRTTYHEKKTIIIPNLHPSTFSYQVIDTIYITQKWPLKQISAYAPPIKQAH